MNETVLSVIADVDLVLFVVDRLNFNGDHFSTASRSQDVPVITLNGVSKVYYAPGWRIGYMAFHDPKSNTICLLYTSPSPRDS